MHNIKFNTYCCFPYYEQRLFHSPDACSLVKEPSKKKLAKVGAKAGVKAGRFALKAVTEVVKKKVPALGTGKTFVTMRRILLVLGYKKVMAILK